MTIKSILSSVAVLTAAAGVLGTTTAVSANVHRAPEGAVNEVAGKWEAGNSASKVSDAHIQVTEGFLSLDQVPDMNFGIAARSANAQTFNLAGNESMVDDHGNQKGLLQITDSRNYAIDPATGASSAIEEKDYEDAGLGWKLGVTVGDFENNITSETGAAGGWVLNFKQTQLKNSNSKAPQMFAQEVTAGETAEKNLITADFSEGTGTTTAYYKDEKDASLDIPANVTAGNWVAPITWTLQATADSK